MEDELTDSEERETHTHERELFFYYYSADLFHQHGWTPRDAKERTGGRLAGWRLQELTPQIVTSMNPQHQQTLTHTHTLTLPPFTTVKTYAGMLLCKLPTILDHVRVIPNEVEQVYSILWGCSCCLPATAILPVPALLPFC